MVQLKHVAVRRTLTCPPRGGAPKNNCSSFSFQGTGTQKTLYTYLYDLLWFISFATKTPPENQLKTQHLSRKRKGQNQSVVDFLPKEITQPQQAAAHFQHTEREHPKNHPHSMLNVPNPQKNLENICTIMRRT